MKVLLLLSRVVFYLTVCCGGVKGTQGHSVQVPVCLSSISDLSPLPLSLCCVCLSFFSVYKPWTLISLFCVCLWACMYLCTICVCLYTMWWNVIPMYIYSSTFELLVLYLFKCYATLLFFSTTCSVLLFYYICLVYHLHVSFNFS